MIEKMGGVTLAKPEDKKVGSGRIGESISNFKMYPNWKRCKDPTGRPPFDSVLEYVGNITIDLINKGILEMLHKPDDSMDIQIDANPNNIKEEINYIDKYVNPETLEAINARWILINWKQHMGRTVWRD